VPRVIKGQRSSFEFLLEVERVQLKKSCQEIGRVLMKTV
jgi:hypothetical protein